jgi:hypothetical protein
MLSAAPLVIIAQAAAPTTPPVAVYVPPPAPPPDIAVMAATNATQRALYEASLRRRCYSEAAIKLILEDNVAALAASRAMQDRQRAVLTELSVAADATPFDLARLEAARKTWRKLEAQLEEERDRRQFQLLRRLSPPDQAIYARQFAIYMAFPPRRYPTCEAKGEGQPYAPPPVRLPPLPKKK